MKPFKALSVCGSSPKPLVEDHDVSRIQDPSAFLKSIGHFIDFRGSGLSDFQVLRVVKTRLASRAP